MEAELCCAEREGEGSGLGACVSVGLSGVAGIAYVMIGGHWGWASGRPIHPGRENSAGRGR